MLIELYTLILLIIGIVTCLHSVYKQSEGYGFVLIGFLVWIPLIGRVLYAW